MRPVLGWHKARFTDAYEANRGSASDAVIQSDMIAQALLDLIEQQHGRWVGTATDLLAALPVSEATRKQKGFPAPNTLPERLTRLQNTLAGLGLEIAFTKSTDRTRKKVIVLTSTPPAHRRLSRATATAARYPPVISSENRSPRPFDEGRNDGLFGSARFTCRTAAVRQPSDAAH